MYRACRSTFRFSPGGRLWAAQVIVSCACAHALDCARDWPRPRRGAHVLSREACSESDVALFCARRKACAPRCWGRDMPQLTWNFPCAHRAAQRRATNPHCLPRIVARAANGCLRRDCVRKAVDLGQYAFLNYFGGIACRSSHFEFQQICRALRSSPCEALWRESGCVCSRRFPPHKRKCSWECVRAFHCALGMVWPSDDPLRGTWLGRSACACVVRATGTFHR